MENTELLEPWMKAAVYLLLPLIGILVPAYVTVRSHRSSSPAEPALTPTQLHRDRVQMDHISQGAKLDRLLVIAEQTREDLRRM
jgi:hypothetical protein